MNLRAIANPITTRVNPNTIGTVKTSNGYTQGAGFRQVPAYIVTPDVPMQVQALTASEIEHLDSMNIANVMHAVYLYGNTESLVRGDGKGGDLLLFNGKTWLVVAVLERWASWCKVAVAAQLDPTPAQN